MNSFEELQSYLEEGKKYFQESNYSSALECFNKAIAIDSQNKEAMFELGKTYCVLKNYLRAIELLEGAQRLSPLDERICVLLAQSYKCIREYVVALRKLINFKKQVRNVPGVDNELLSIYNEKSFSKMVQNYNFKGQYELAREFILEQLQFIPKENIFLRNKLLNELEIAEGQTTISSRPRRLTVTLSNRCNLSCIMCLTRYTKWEVSRETIEEIYSFFPYLEKVMWQGGEVFALDFFEEILSVGFQYPHLRHSIVTNGQLISEKMAEKLVTSNVELTFSVDGVSKEVYEYIRRGANFEILIKNLKLISDLKKRHKSNMVLNLNVAIMKSNYHQLEYFIDFAKDYGFEFICIMPIHIHLKTPEDIFTNQDMQALSFITEVSPKIEEKVRQYGLRLENRLPRLSEKQDKPFENNEDAVLRHAEAKTNRKLLCHIPWQQLLIDYDGSVRPDCLCRIDKSAGSLLNNVSLEDIWNNEVMVEYRKRIINHDYADYCNPLCFSGKISESHLKIP